MKTPPKTGPRTKPAPGLLTRDGVPTSLRDFVLKQLASPNSRSAYGKGIADLYTFAAGRPITTTLLQDWRIAMAGTLSTSTVNVRLAAARALIKGAQKKGLVSAPEAFEMLSVAGLPSRGVRTGNWLTLAQLRKLLAVPNQGTLRGSRNYCILAIMAGCGLRLNEVARLQFNTMQQREGRWLFTDLIGKGGRVRTVAIPEFVRMAINAWLRQSKIREGLLIRQLTLKPEGLSQKGIREIVQKAAQKINVTNFGPHDLRRTCARLCRDAGADVEQIQAMLGHADPSTTHLYLGTVQNLKDAPNDKIVIAT